MNQEPSEISIDTADNGIISNKWRLRSMFGAMFAVIAIFLFVPTLEKNFYTHLLLQTSFTLLIFSTIYAIEGNRIILNMGIVLLVPFLYFDAISFQHRSFSYMLMAHGFSLVFTMLAIGILMKKILHAVIVNAELVFGALMVYLLSGVLWANFYFIENLISPGGFQGIGILNFDNATFPIIYEQQFNFLYYSFATLATLGMGDITPLSHLAKSLTALEAMFGQLFVAIIIAKLVGVWWHVPHAK